MCASYGLDPRFSDQELLAEADAGLLDGLRTWAAEHEGETLRPTGRHKRNLNPLVVPRQGDAALENAWWGYLVDGEPARFPSINTRSERLLERPGGARARAIVPTTGWFEMAKPERVWHRYTVDDGALFGMAAVTRTARTPEGETVTCYSIVMRPAAEHLTAIHERMPVLIPASYVEEWLHADGDADVVAGALAAAGSLDPRVRARPRDAGASATLF